MKIYDPLTKVFSAVFGPMMIEAAVAFIVGIIGLFTLPKTTAIVAFALILAALFTPRRFRFKAIDFITEGGGLYGFCILSGEGIALLLKTIF